MIAINSMMVCLDLSEVDEKLVAFTRTICKLLEVKKVYFVHNIKIYDLSDDFRELFENVDLEQEIEANIEDLLQEQFNCPTEYEILVSEEPNTEIILADIVKRYKVELTLIGKKSSEKGTGSLGIKLLRILPCSMLVFPEETRHDIQHVLVPIDFSEASVHAMRLSKSLADQLGLQLELLHVYRLPTQYFPLLSEERAVRTAEEHVKGKFRTLQKKHKEIADVPYHFVRAAGKSIPERIVKHLDKKKHGLLVLGLKGNDPLPSLSLGSVPTILYNTDINVPLWLVYSEDVIR
ncbi:MAG: universal stress protein [Anditalea sp.]